MDQASLPHDSWKVTQYYSRGLKSKADPPASAILGQSFNRVKGGYPAYQPAHQQDISDSPRIADEAAQKLTGRYFSVNSKKFNLIRQTARRKDPAFRHRACGQGADLASASMAVGVVDETMAAERPKGALIPILFILKLKTYVPI